MTPASVDSYIDEAEKYFGRFKKMGEHSRYAEGIEKAIKDRLGENQNMTTKEAWNSFRNKWTSPDAEWEVELKSEKLVQTFRELTIKENDCDGDSREWESKSTEIKFSTFEKSYFLPSKKKMTTKRK